MLKPDIQHVFLNLEYFTIPFKGEWEYEEIKAAIKKSNSQLGNWIVKCHFFACQLFEEEAKKGFGCVLMPQEYLDLTWGNDNVLR